VEWLQAAGRLRQAGQPPHSISGADVAGVEGAGDGGIFGAFEDGATVGEDRHFVRRDTEAEKEFVVADVGHGGGEAISKGSQVERAIALVNLDRIAAAHGDMGLDVAMEVGEIAMGAGAAVWVAGNADGLEVAAPDVTGDEEAVQRGSLPGEELYRLGDFERGD
jgi:hypothetical protein